MKFDNFLMIFDDIFMIFDAKYSEDQDLRRSAASPQILFLLFSLDYYTIIIKIINNTIV